MGDQARLRLAPSSARGWFGGRALLARSPVAARAGATLREAGAALEAAFEGTDAGATVVLASYDGTCTIVRFAEVDNAGASQVAPSGLGPSEPLLDPSSWDLSAREFRAGVRQSRERIAAGDVYVLNLTARLTGTLRVAPEEAFEVLLSRSGSEMSAFAEGLPGPTPWVASVSPERFLRVERGLGGRRVVEVCPIKGTRPRGLSPVLDAQLAHDLLADEKELAEHVMIVDLERNDIGRACASGTVHVDPLYEVVQTPYCHQLVSTVRGVMSEEAGLADLLEATFPCGSVTGAPKRAAMRIIAELEASGRGAYCGALLVAIPGHLDSSVLIRTLEGDAGDGALWGSGCGITHESDASSELLELLLKASPVLGDSVPTVALRETARVVDGRIPLLERHLERLAAGGCGPTLLARVRDEARRALAAVGATPARARLGVTVTPDGAVAVGVSDQPSTLSVPGGPRLVPVEIPAAPPLPAGAAKPASRRFWDRAHHKAELLGAHQALLHLSDGRIVDGSTANVWLVLDGALVTPPAPPAVAGVARELVFDLAAGLGLEAREQTLTLADCEAAEEVGLSNAVGGFVAVEGRGGPVTARVAEAVERAFRPTVACP